MRWLLVIIGVALLWGCASIGRPEGGERDMLPPEFISSNPAEGQRNVTSTKYTLIFDENLQLKDASNKVIVSPAQSQQPVVSANGRRIRVELRDSLIPDVTYTIDFGDAIQDLNEGNALDGFALAFSTGADFDSLSISGIVLETRTLEPAQEMLVGLHRAPMADTTLTHVPFERVTRTNQLGQFTLRNLQPDTYRIFAINDVNRDNKWDRSEDIAFLDVDLTPRAETIEVTDTLTTAAGTDSLAVRSATRFLPNDVLLTWFNENYTRRYLQRNERPERRRLQLTFGAPDDSLPSFNLLTPDSVNAGLLPALIEYTLGKDTLNVWLTDTALISRDTLLVDMRWRMSDSLDLPAWTNDTLRFVWREPRQRGKQKKPKEDVVEQLPVTTDSLATDSVALPPAPQIEFASVSIRPSGSIDLDQALSMTSQVPLTSIDRAGIRLETGADSTWTLVKPQPQFVADHDGTLTSWHMDYEWTPGAGYRLTVDSMAIVDAYGLHNKPQAVSFKAKEIEEYSALYFRITGIPDSTQAVVELLKSDTPYRTAVVDASGVATLEYLQPGTYYARLFIDRNFNGKWDTGNVGDTIQPEDVYYYPRKLNLKKNWQVEQNWDLDVIPVDLQKPSEIKKNKPKANKWDQQNNRNSGRRDEDEDEDEVDPFSASYFNNR